MTSSRNADRRGDDRPGPVFVLGLCALVLAPTLAYRMGVDQGVFAYMGDALLHGRWPYVGTWESDFPGLIFLQAVEIFVLGKSIAMFRAFDMAFQLANAFLIFRIADRVSGRRAAVFAAVLFCLIYQGYGPWNTAQREGFGLLFVLGGFWMYLTADRRPAAVTAAAIGLGLGVAVTIKPTLLALSLFYLPLLGRLGASGAMRVAAAAGAGVLAPAALLAAGYWATGTLRDLYEACIAYQAVYTARLRGSDPLLAFWLQKFGRLGWNAVALPVVYAPFLLAGNARWERFMLWLAMVGSVYAVFVQGTFAGYHYLPGLAIGAILVGDLVSIVADRLSGPVRVARALPYVLLCAAAAFYLRNAPVRDLVGLHFLHPPRAGEFRNGTVFDFTESYDVAEFLREHTTPGQTVQVWGYESLVYYLADRPAASRFQMTHPLVMRVPGEDLTPMQVRWRAEFIDDIDRHMPAYVAVVQQDHWWWAPGEQSSEELLDDFPEWKARLERDYTLETTIGRFLVYRRSVLP